MFGVCMGSIASQIGRSIDIGMGVVVFFHLHSLQIDALFFGSRFFFFFVLFGVF